jgi:hypothetical protein
MGTLFLLMWPVSFACIYYSIRKRQGYITMPELLISLVVSMVPMFNLVIAFYSIMGVKKK